MSLVELAELTAVNKLCKLLSTLPSAHKSFGNPLFSSISLSVLEECVPEFLCQISAFRLFPNCSTSLHPFPHRCLLFSVCKVLPSHMRQFPPL